MEISVVHVVMPLLGRSDFLVAVVRQTTAETRIGQLVGHGSSASADHFEVHPCRT